MKLVLDPEWEVCYIEVTPAEEKILKFPPRLSLEEIKELRVAALQGAPLARFSWGKPPEGYQELCEKAYAIWEIAWPFARKFAENRRAEPPSNRIMGIEVRVVAE